MVASTGLYIAKSLGSCFGKDQVSKKTFKWAFIGEAFGLLAGVGMFIGLAYLSPSVPYHFYDSLIKGGVSSYIYLPIYMLLGDFAFGALFHKIGLIKNPKEEMYFWNN